MEDEKKEINKKVIVKKMAILGDVYVGKTSIAVR
jgi:hypothetical protein